MPPLVVDTSIGHCQVETTRPIQKPIKTMLLRNVNAVNLTVPSRRLAVSRQCGDETGSLTDPAAIRFCPICLCGSPLYFRREWRLAFVTVCPRHRQLLWEQCEACQAPCLFTRLDLPYPLGCCHYCHRHLTLVSKEAPKEATLPIELHLAFQQKVWSVLRHSPAPGKGSTRSGK